MENFCVISLGAILGANARYWISDWTLKNLKPDFPFGTFIINITGCFLIGFFLTIVTEKSVLDPRWRLFFVIGFLGSYTTFSTYAYESFSLMYQELWLSGLLNILGSTLLSVIAVGLGVVLGKLI